MTKNQNMIEKCEGTEIEWKDGKNVTQKKIKKKQKPKKGQPGKTITKTVEVESFFNFFKTREMPDEDELAGTKPPKEKEEDEDGEPEKDAAELMDEDFELANEFKDQLIPLALEYYLEVIQDEDDDGDDDDEDDDDDDAPPKGGKGGKPKNDSDEEDDQPKGGKKSAKKGGAAAGGDKQECKQQ